MSNSNNLGALLSRAVLVVASGIAIQLGVAHAADQPPASATPPEAPAKAGPVPVVQPSDTIGEAADKQRLMRMLAEKHRTGAAAPGGDVMVPSIVLKRPPGSGNAAQTKAAVPTNDPQVVLNEVLRGPTKLVAGIELNGVNRYVSVGHDIGNGWRVQSISQYNVVLVTPESLPSNATATSKSKTAKGSPSATPRLRQLVLPLGLRTVVAPSPSTSAPAR